MMDRLPAIPLVTNNPYLSLWCPADRLSDADSVHWAGDPKPLKGLMTVDGRTYRFLGSGKEPAADTLSLLVTPTATTSVFSAGGVKLCARFVTPALPDDPDLMSTPITMLEWTLQSIDGMAHSAALSFTAPACLCWDGEERPRLLSAVNEYDGLKTAFMGQVNQKLLCHSADHITIDWGYLYLASELPIEEGEDGLSLHWQGDVDSSPLHLRALIGYDEVASILYFGSPCKPWYARHGKSIVDALRELYREFDEVLARCKALDDSLLTQARDLGGEDYALILSAAWRHTIAAHTLIATPKGEMALLSKENDSNGCMGTVDLSYPSAPLFLKYNPSLVDALCRPVLEFASMPIWNFDFAPHDVGRYPIANGQVYAARMRASFNGVPAVYPPFYLYPASAAEEVYKMENQMPVEESGNMLILLWAAAKASKDLSLIKQYRPLLDTWVRYLDKYGEDPGNQLCTDDFAGHLARNVNLSAKAIVGLACYGKMLKALGEEESQKWRSRAREMAKNWLTRAGAGKNGTYLTFDKEGWSMKYNLAWDRVLDLDLLPPSFYNEEIESYLPRMNTYGLPLDSRATYTKSDWILWTASMAQTREQFQALIAPVAKYLRESKTRVAFSDWYYTDTGDYRHFIARSVQGGLFMPLLCKDKILNKQ